MGRGGSSGGITAVRDDVAGHPDFARRSKSVKFQPMPAPEQLSEREMADVLGCPAGTVKSRRSRAMARLRAALSVEAVGGD